MRVRKTPDERLLQGISYIVVSIFAAIALLPFIILVMSSFASEGDILLHGYRLIPGEFSLKAYRLVFLNPQKILNAYKVTIIITVVGTATSLFMSMMAAYVMYRKDVKYRNKLAFFLFFTELFQGGLVSFFIVVSSILDLKNTLWVLILVPMFSVFNILVLRNFIRGSIPDSLPESAKIDGAGDFTIFIKIILPLSKPALASIGLFTALIYWNDWWTAMMFVEKQPLQPLQYILYLILSTVNMASNMINNAAYIDMPKQTIKLAMTVISTGPIIFLYAFVQKYFVKGITLGAVKG
jgi:putative aldouronate transport system permease protein